MLHDLSRVLVVDGVTGAGKSSVLRALRSFLDVSPRGPLTEFIYEDDTLGDIMDQVRDPEWRKAPSFDALEAVVMRVEKALAAVPSRRFVLERFHLTAYALHPDWKRLKQYDRRLANLGARQILLTYPSCLAEKRAIERPDRDSQQWSAGMDDWYGSRRSAVAAVVQSQRRRWSALQRSALPFLHVDTRENRWTSYAEATLVFWNDGAPVDGERAPRT
jgi:predicted ATPase